MNMRKLIIALLILSFFSCKKDSLDNIKCGCEVENTQKNNIPSWLTALIERAEEDRTGNYLGTIWLTKYKGQDLFVTDMRFASGLLGYWFFECSGKHLLWRSAKEPICPADPFVGADHFYVEDEDDFRSFIKEMELNIIVYSNFPYKH
jgi:hypothetical protein